MGHDSPEGAHKRRRLGLWLASAGTLVGLATGILTLTDQLFPNDDRETPKVVVESAEKKIPRFKGVAGHLEDAQAVLDFLDQHDGEVVRLQLGFKLGSEGDFTVKDVPRGDGTVVRTVTSVMLFTECNDLPPEDEPSLAKGCMATALSVRGRPTDESGGFLSHGFPVLKGYFAVDATGGLHMGITPVRLKPLTLEQAKRLG